MPSDVAAFICGDAGRLEAQHHLPHGAGDAEQVVGGIVRLGGHHLDLVAERLQVLFDMGIGQEVLHDTNLYDRNSQFDQHFYSSTFGFEGMEVAWAGTV